MKGIPAHPQFWFSSSQEVDGLASQKSQKKTMDGSSSDLVSRHDKKKGKKSRPFSSTPSHRNNKKKEKKKD